MSDSVNLVAALGGELVTYQPYGGVAKQFKAIVERQPPQQEVAGGHQYLVNTIQVTFPRDATDGVLAVQEGKDKLRFKQSLSDAQEKEFVISSLLKEDAGLTASDGGMFAVLVERSA